MALMRGGSVKKSAVHDGSSDDESGTDDESSDSDSSSDSDWAIVYTSLGYFSPLYQFFS